MSSIIQPCYQTCNKLVTFSKRGQDACGCATSTDSSNAIAGPSGRSPVLVWGTGNKWGDVRTNHGAGAEPFRGQKTATPFIPRRNTFNKRHRFSVSTHQEQGWIDCMHIPISFHIQHLKWILVCIPLFSLISDSGQLSIVGLQWLVTKLWISEVLKMLSHAIQLWMYKIILKCKLLKFSTSKLHPESCHRNYLVECRQRTSSKDKADQEFMTFCMYVTQDSVPLSAPHQLTCIIAYCWQYLSYT